MITPEDAKRLVKNRNARVARAQDTADRMEEAELDFVEEALALYFADSDFIEYVTETADDGMATAIDEQLRFFIAFTYNHHSFFEDVSETVDLYDATCQYWEHNDVHAVIFDPKSIGLDYDLKKLAKTLVETICALYQDAGWETSDVEQHTFRLYQKYESSHPFRESLYSYGFEVYY